MPKKIRVVARSLQYDRKQLGRGGEYEVTDVQAKQWQRDGKAIIIEDLGQDETSQVEIIDRAFLEKVRFHRKEILAILREGDEDEEIVVEVNNSESEAKSSESTALSDAPGSLVTNVGNSNNVPTDSIPADFPGKEDLEKKGINTMAKLKELGYDDLIEKGLRAGLANQIGAKLAEM